MYKKETLNVIMPVYNEGKTLREIIGRVLAQKVVDRLIIINDNSKDDSLAIIRSAASKDKRITYLTNKSNMGKGYSVRRGLSMVKDGIIIIQDADLEYYPEDYGKLLPKVDDNTFALGVRAHRGNEYGHILSRFANDYLTLMFDILYLRSLSDTNTCYKVFKKSMLKGIKLKENGFLIDPEILIDLIKKGYRFAEVKIRYKGRTFSEGKKITAKDGIDQALYLMKRKLSD